MIKIKNNEKILLAILALIMGFSFGTYIWTPNTQSVMGGESENPNPQNIPSFQSTGPTILQLDTNIESSIVEVINQNETSESELLVDISVEKFRASSIDGPWHEADTPAGSPIIVGDNVYWKIEVVNTGKVDLELEYIDFFDGVMIDIEDFVDGLPSSVEAGMTVTITYKMHVFYGVHKNNIKVIGTFEDIIVEDEDNAYYTGIRLLNGSSSDKIPTFVIPEYPLGALGGILSLVTSFVFTKRRKSS